MTIINKNLFIIIEKKSAFLMVDELRISLIIDIYIILKFKIKNIVKTINCYFFNFIVLLSNDIKK